MSRTNHHSERARLKKFGAAFYTGISPIYEWDSAGNFSRISTTRRMKWPKQVDLITAAILGERLIPTPPKRKRCTWHVEWMASSRGSGSRSRSTHMWLHYHRPERAQVRALLRRVLHLMDLEEPPLFPQGRKPHPYYY